MLVKLNGITDQLVKLTEATIKGASRKIKALDLLGIIISLSSNFKPSTKGCKRPQNPTTFGPWRFCKDAITFLSAKVKKASDKTKGKTTKKQVIILIRIVVSIFINQTKFKW